MKKYSVILWFSALLFSGHVFGQATLVQIDPKEGKKMIQAAEKAGRVIKCDKGKTCYPNTSWLVTCKTVGDDVKSCDAALLDPNR